MTDAPPTDKLFTPTKALENKELIEIFVEGIRQAIHAVQPSDLMILHYNGGAFLVGLDKAAKAANGLAHTQANTTWLLIRDTIEKIRKTFVAIVSRKIINIATRKQLVQILEGVYMKSQQIASAKSMSRQSVVANLDRRKEVDERRRNIKLVE